jgi:DNA-binding Lrp family transcriptional regulator
MVTSFTLARIHPQMDKDAYDIIITFPEVSEVIITYGEYDLIIKVESKSLEDLDYFIFNKLRAIQGVAATTTLIEAKPKNLVIGDS